MTLSEEGFGKHNCLVSMLAFSSMFIAIILTAVYWREVAREVWPWFPCKILTVLKYFCSSLKKAACGKLFQLLLVEREALGDFNID